MVINLVITDIAIPNSALDPRLIHLLLESVGFGLRDFPRGDHLTLTTDLIIDAT